MRYTVLATAALVAGVFVLSLTVAEERRPSVSSYVIEVIADSPETEVEFLGAIGHDGKLDLIKTSTPFRTEFEALRITAMFQTVESAASVKAQLLTERNGELKNVGSSLAVLGRSSRTQPNRASHEASVPFEMEPNISLERTVNLP